MGNNGAGKTTLLRIISGMTQPESGEIIIPKDIRIGYLPQEKLLNSKKTVYNEAFTAFEELIEIEKQIKHNLFLLEKKEDYESKQYANIIEKLDDLNQQHALLGGNSNEADIEKILKGLGFSSDDFHKEVNTFSGGWQMRLELAKVLLQRPELLLLDEPTNHLDIESIEWIESFLSAYSGAMIVVSHDRAFLDTVTTRTIEISFGKTEDYKACYSDYVLLKQEKREHQKSKLNNQQKQTAQIELFINRFRYKSTKSRQVQSRIKLLEKMEKIEIDEIDVSKINFMFPPAPKSGNIVVDAENVAKSYGELYLLRL